MTERAEPGVGWRLPLLHEGRYGADVLVYAGRDRHLGMQVSAHADRTVLRDA
jgi:hypothetical protein